MARRSLIQRELDEYVMVGDLKVPKRPYHEWEFLKILPFEQLYTKYADHRRLSVFVEKGLQCANPDCNRVGTHLIITVDQGGGKHVDVVDAEFKLMTVDHIHPKSAGGGEEMENKQPMCEEHNVKKSNKLIPY